MKKTKYKYCGLNYTNIKLPPMARFASKDKAISPFSNFHNWVANKFGGLPLGNKIEVAATILHPKDGAKLRAVVIQWLRSVHKIPKVRIANVFSWHNLDLGPREIYRTAPDWLKPGYAYVDKDGLFGDKHGMPGM